MMDYIDNTQSSVSLDAVDMRYLKKPRGKGYSLRMPTPPILVGTENPWTGGPFKKTAALGLDTRVHAEAIRIRDVRVGQIRQLEADAIAASGKRGIGTIIDLSPEAAEDWRKMRSQATEEELEGYDHVLSGQLETAVDTDRESAAKAFGALVFKGAMPLEKALGQYLEERKEGNVFGFAPLALTTALNVRSTMKHLIAFLGLDTPLLQDVTPDKAFRFRTEYLPIEKGLSAATVAKHMTLMRGLWAWGIADKHYLKTRSGKAMRNPWIITEKGTPRKKVSARGDGKTREAYQPKQVEELLSRYPTWGSKKGDIVRLALVTGCRADEIAALPLANVKEDGSGFYIRKGKTKNAFRYIPLVGDARDLTVRRLKQVLGMQKDTPKDHHRFFPEWPLKPSTGKANAVAQWFTRYRRQVLGVETDGKLVMHSFRHTWKTVARRGGVAEDRIKELGGWTGKRDASDVYDHGLLEAQLETAQSQIWAALKEQGYLSAF
tara:strand:+ start:34 stop:1506 length:1473 start_codon:yes stop_codon:yes gene_type:complete